MRRIEFVTYALPQGYDSVGGHPLFRHMSQPPEGYAFEHHPWEGPVPSQLFARFFLDGDPCREAPHLGHPLADALFAEARAIALRARELGAPDAAIRAFFQSRNWEGSLRVPADAELLFLPTFATCVSVKPWALEIEDMVTALFPFTVNGLTKRVVFEGAPFLKVYQAFYERPACRAIVTHVEATAEALRVVFRGSSVVDKILVVKAGVAVPPAVPKPRWDPSQDFPLLFTASWHQEALSFALRGGREFLAAARILMERHPQVRLILRTSLPDILGHELAYFDQHPRVAHHAEFLPEAHLDALHREARLFVLPSARLHVVSLLHAQALGLPVLASDGWGLSEYFVPGHTGVALVGRGPVSVQNPKTGLLEEDYDLLLPPYPPAQSLVDGIVAAVEGYMAQPERLEAHEAQAQAWVAAHHSLEAFNRQLGEALARMWPAGPTQAWSPPSPAWVAAAASRCQAAGEAALAERLWGDLFESKDPEVEAALLGEVEAALESGELEAALPLLTVGLTYRGQELPWLLAAAVSAHMGGDAEVALDFLAKAIARDALHEEAWHSLVTLHLEQGMLEAAAKAAQAYTSLHPELTVAWVLRAEVLLRQGDEAGSSECLAQAEAVARLPAPV